MSETHSVRRTSSALPMFQGCNLRGLRPGGRLVQVGLLSGQDNIDILVGVVLYNQLKIIGTVMTSRRAAGKREMARRFAENGLPMFHDGRLRPVLWQALPLARVAEAHRAMGTGGGFGKDRPDDRR